MSDEVPINLRAVADYFGLVGTAPVEKDNQYPAYAADVAGETQAAVAALQGDTIYRQRYDDFILAMVYGDRPEFNVALGTVIEQVEHIFKRRGGGT